MEELLTQLKAKLIELISLLTMSPKIVKLSLLIAQYEGNEPGMRAFRNNNPGNFRYSAVGYAPVYGAVERDKDGFAIFPTKDKGWLYLRNFLLTLAKGQSVTYNFAAKKLKLKNCSELTLTQMMRTYAPSEDHNDPDAYAKYLIKGLNVDEAFQLKDLLL